MIWSKRLAGGMATLSLLRESGSGPVPAPDELSSALTRIVPCDHYRGRLGTDGLGRYSSRYRSPVGGLVDDTQVGWERRRLFDEALIELQPFRLVEGDSAGDTAAVPVHGDEAAIGGRPLRDDDLVGERGNAHGLDLRVELRRPETRDSQVRPSIGLGADHVVRCDLGLCDCVTPVGKCQELVVVQRVRETRHISGYEDVVADHGVNGEGPRARVTGDSPRADR